MSEPYYITTAIAYPNGKPHIGHAYEAIAADAIARFHRMQGRDVRLVTGTDEHGLKMVQTARAAGRDTLEFADEMSGHFKAMCEKLNISYDSFVRTSEPRHHAASVALWKAMEASGDLYLDRYEGWYSVRDEAFYDEKELIKGEGGVKLSPQGTPVEWTKEETWFFRLSKYQDRLLAHYNDHPDFLRPETRANEVIRFVEGGLRDLSVSRTSFDWGVPVPGSPGHVMYVWVDALTTYMTGVGYPDQDGDFARFWPADLHLIGKDIVRFHAVYWPAFLMSAGLPLPKAIFGHGFLLARGEKMSKSLGNVVDPIELADKFGAEALRYFFLREVSFGQDGSYSPEAIVTRVNADLANGLGNLVQRYLSIIHRNYNGIVPKIGDEFQIRNAFPNVNNDQFELDYMNFRRVYSTLEGHLGGVTMQAKTQFEMLDLSDGLQTLMTGVSHCNQFIANWAPWKEVKENRDLTTLSISYFHDKMSELFKAFYPVIPDAVEKIWYLMGYKPESLMKNFKFSDKYEYNPDSENLPPLSPLFPRLEMPEGVVE